MSDWIIEKIPQHHSYVKPFFGSGAVFFNKPRSNIETINDVDSDIVNLFNCIRNDPEKLSREIYYIPYAREIYDGAFSQNVDEPFQKAVNFLIRLNMGYGFRANAKVGWKNDVQGREKAYAARDWITLPDRIQEVAERLRGVQIENRNAIEIIDRFNFSNVFMYCDPPYLLETRSGGRQYTCEMQRKDHIDLLDILCAHKGKIILSGYDSELYNDRLSGWYKEYKTVMAQSGKKKQECIWMNFEPEKDNFHQIYLNL